MAENKVLVIDDDPVVRILVEEYLCRQGYQVSSLSSGKGALEAVEKTTPNFIVLDYMMPEVTGIEVLKDIRCNSKTPGVPVLLLSSDATLLKEAEKMENTICLEKPFTMEKLLSEMAKLGEKHYL